MAIRITMRRGRVETLGNRLREGRPSRDHFCEMKADTLPLESPLQIIRPLRTMLRASSFMTHHPSVRACGPWMALASGACLIPLRRSQGTFSTC
jgi:hypothetical protein